MIHLKTLFKQDRRGVLFLTHTLLSVSVTIVISQEEENVNWGQDHYQPVYI